MRYSGAGREPPWWNTPRRGGTSKAASAKYLHLQGGNSVRMDVVYAVQQYVTRMTESVTGMKALLLDKVGSIVSFMIACVVGCTCFCAAEATKI